MGLRYFGVALPTIISDFWLDPNVEIFYLMVNTFVPKMFVFKFRVCTQSWFLKFVSFGRCDMQILGKAYLYAKCRLFLLFEPVVYKVSWILSWCTYATMLLHLIISSFKPSVRVQIQLYDNMIFQNLWCTTNLFN